MKKILIAGLAIFAATLATSIFADEGETIVEEVSECPPQEQIECPAPQPVVPAPPVCETCQPCQEVIIIRYHQPVFIEPCFGFHSAFDCGFAPMPIYNNCHFISPCLPVSFCW